MKISRIKIAEALAATLWSMYGKTEEYDKLPHWRKLHWLGEADKFIRAIKWIKENENGTVKERGKSGT